MDKMSLTGLVTSIAGISREARLIYLPDVMFCLIESEITST